MVLLVTIKRFCLLGLLGLPVKNEFVFASTEIIRPVNVLDGPGAGGLPGPGPGIGGLPGPGPGMGGLPGPGPGMGGLPGGGVGTGRRTNMRKALDCGGMLRVIIEEKTASIHMPRRISHRQTVLPDISKIVVVRLTFSLSSLIKVTPAEERSA